MPPLLVQVASCGLSLYVFIYSFARSFVRSSVFYHSAEVIIFLGLSSLFTRQLCGLSIVVKSRKTLLVVLKTFPKRAKSELLWQLPPFSPTFLLFSSSSYALCFYFTRFLFFVFFFFVRHSGTQLRTRPRCSLNFIDLTTTITVFPSSPVKS